MDVRRISRSVASAAPQSMGVSAQLADARSRLRSVTPAGADDAVMAEVHRLREERGLSLLAALRLVYEKLGAGWIPVRR
jgi:hypothetical protein